MSLFKEINLSHTLKQNVKVLVFKISVHTAFKCYSIVQTCIRNILSICARKKDLNNLLLLVYYNAKCSFAFYLLFK